MSAELGNYQIAALWVGGFGLMPILLPRNTPWSRGKHLGGLASCPGRTGEGGFKLRRVSGGEGRSFPLPTALQGGQKVCPCHP